MANTRSAKKRVRQTRVRTLRNRIYKSRIRTAIRRLQEVVAAGDREQALELLRRAASIIDKAAKKGVIHANAAARRKSRLHKLVNQNLAA